MRNVNERVVDASARLRCAFFDGARDTMNGKRRTGRDASLHDSRAREHPRTRRKRARGARASAGRDERDWR